MKKTYFNLKLFTANILQKGFLRQIFYKKAFYLKYFVFLLLLIFTFSCDSDLNFSSSSSVAKEREEKEDNEKDKEKKEPQKPIPVRKAITSDDFLWQTTNKTAEDQGPWQREFELQMGAYLAKTTEADAIKADFLAKKYRLLTNAFKVHDVHPGMPLSDLNTLRVKITGVKKYYADTNKTIVAKEEFYEMEQSILTFIKDKKKNHAVYYQSKTNKIKENIYLENGKLKVTVPISKSQNILGEATSGNNSGNWAVYAAYYRKLRGQARHSDTIKIPANNSFGDAFTAIYGVEGYVRATLSSYNINTQITLEEAVKNKKHLQILDASISGESQQYEGGFLNPTLPVGANDVVTMKFAFEDWKTPNKKNKGGEGSGDYNDGELIVVIGRKKRVNAANFTRLWNAHPGNDQAGYCPPGENGCATHFSDVIFGSSGLDINIEVWKKYIKSRSPAKPNNNYKTTPTTTKNVGWGSPYNQNERVVRANEIYMFLKEVVFDGNFIKPANHNTKTPYVNKKGIVFFENCWGGGDHIDLWDGTKYSGVGEFKYWGKYNEDKNLDFDSSSDGNPCPIYFLEF